MSNKTKTATMPYDLTAENGAKAVLDGKFYESIDVDCPDCGIDSGISEDEICQTCYDEGFVAHHNAAVELLREMANHTPALAE